MSDKRSVVEAFDSIADRYDSRYTSNPSMRLMRTRVWKELRVRIKPGDRILELGCGTGEDAVFLARSGCEVMATDCSSHMLECAARKASDHGLSKKIRFQQLDIEEIPRFRRQSIGRFDGILSNFGGLNTVADLSSLDAALSDLLKSGGWFMAAVMGPCCLWDWTIEIVHLRFSSVRNRRPVDGTKIKLGDYDVSCFFPPPEAFIHAFGSFKPEDCRALGLLLPPPRFTENRGKLSLLWKTMEALEQPMVGMRLFRGCGDHYLVTLRKP